MAREQKMKEYHIKQKKRIDEYGKQKFKQE